jgi:SAM-dependent methyltransferase
MFSNYLYKTNTSYKNFLHFKNYASEVDKLFKKKKGKILDIASNDGTFLNFFNKKKFFRLGIDPAKNLKKITNSKGILQIDNFFTDKFSNQIKKKFQQFDIITANHVCAHVENLNDFFLGVKNLLKDDGIFIFEISYRGSVLKKNTFDTIYHEHLDYHALFPISKFLKKFKLHLFNFKITEAQGGSLRIYASKNYKTINQKKINNQIFREKNYYKLFNISTYKKFEKKINNCKNELHKILKNFDEKNYKIAGYGAAAKTTTLLNYFDLSKNKNIKFIFDDNKLKQDLYLPGTSIKILNPKHLFYKNLDVLIIFAWNYSDVIIKKINKNKLFKKQSLKFLIPFPKPKIVK